MCTWLSGLLYIHAAQCFGDSFRGWNRTWSSRYISPGCTDRMSLMPRSLWIMELEWRGQTIHTQSIAIYWRVWQLFQPGNQISARKQEDAPPDQLLAILFEIREPVSFNWMNEGTSSTRDWKFKSWAIPFGIYTKGQLRHTVTHRDANTSQVLNCLIPSSSQGHQILLLPEMKYSTPSNFILCTVLSVRSYGMPEAKSKSIPYQSITTRWQWSKESICAWMRIWRRNQVYRT